MLAKMSAATTNSTPCKATLVPSEDASLLKRWRNAIVYKRRCSTTKAVLPARATVMRTLPRSVSRNSPQTARRRTNSCVNTACSSGTGDLIDHQDLHQPGSQMAPRIFPHTLLAAGQKQIAGFATILTGALMFWTTEGRFHKGPVKMHRQRPPKTSIPQRQRQHLILHRHCATRNEANAANCTNLSSGQRIEPIHQYNFQINWKFQAVLCHARCMLRDLAPRHSSRKSSQTFSKVCVQKRCGRWFWSLHLLALPIRRAHSTPH